MVGLDWCRVDDRFAGGAGSRGGIREMSGLTFGG